MLLLFYAIVGMIFGSLSSYYASKLNKSQKDWYTLGQIFLFLPLIFLISKQTIKK
ncbi:MAG: hypothetical protein HZA74_08425 [Ignavibacteriales bacterium]|nr:hypothetical protein [Ignavibacteriales bacterium]